MKPTDEQVKVFWEWCGLPLAKLIPPRIDLNNLFKYAVPKLVEENQWVINLGYTPSLPKIYHVRINDSINAHLATFIAQSKDPALALFWALYKVMEEALT